MKTLIVDDNKISLEFLNEICMDSPYVYVAGTFTDPEAAWKFAKDNYIELALLDVRMPKLNGIELGKRIRSIYPECVTQKSRVKAEKTKIFFQKASSGFGDVSFKERSGRFKA